MLFSSQLFILVFLPICLLLYYLFSNNEKARILVLISASLIFYAYWDIRFLPLLVCSICINWLIVKYSFVFSSAGALIAGVIFNLLLIGVFKYYDFFWDTLVYFLPANKPDYSFILPLGISFFTFQQISYLIDILRGRAKQYSFDKYFLYISFFPQLIAGPIIRHNQFITQLVYSPVRGGLYERLSRGWLLFVLGLIKKIFFADEAALYANSLYSGFTPDSYISSVDAWQAALFYTLQLYFDFSSYSDMALGLGLMFGFVLPVNFNAPYRAKNLQEFWRKWHITLSNFLRDYVYIPLGGNRNGAAAQLKAILITMLLCGLWHGAGWTFVVWGGFHGLGIMIYLAWKRQGLKLPSLISWFITINFVICGWALFRAGDFAVAINQLHAMYMFDFSSVPPDIEKIMLLAFGFLFAILGPTNIDLAMRYFSYRFWLIMIINLLFLITILKIGPGRSMEFIYFQF